MSNNSDYKFLVLYIKNNRKIFTTTSLSISSFEDLIEQRVLRFWKLDEQKGVKNDISRID